MSVALRRPAHYDGSYEPGRLRRAAVRAVTRLGEHQYRVAGNHQKWYDVNLEIDTPCDCMDAQVHGRGCLHELAARLVDGEHALRMALGEILLAQQRRIEELESKKRTKKPKTAEAA